MPVDAGINAMPCAQTPGKGREERTYPEYWSALASVASARTVTAAARVNVVAAMASFETNASGGRTLQATQPT